MTTPFATKLTKNLLNDWSANFSDAKFDVKLAQTTDTSLTVTGTGSVGASTSSTDTYLAIFRIPQDSKTVAVALNTTAAVTSSGSFASTNSEYIKDKDCRTVKQGDVLHFYTPDSGGVYVQVLLYSVN